MLQRRCFLLSLLFIIGVTTLQALTLSVQTGKENRQPFSIIHIHDHKPFECRSKKDSFNVTTQITCIFDSIPSQNIGQLSNNFFHIVTAIEHKTFYVRITPYQKMELYPILFDLSRDNEIYDVKSERSKHWSIVGFKQSNPFDTDEPVGDTAINFPVTFAQAPLPYIGGLDLKGNPIEMNQINDVAEFIKMKQLYNKQHYEAALKAIHEIQERYPQSVFRSEIMLYEIRTLHHLHESEEMLAVSKRFIRDYSSDQNIAEVLVYTAHAYSQLGMFGDADYFYEHLFNEHANSYFAYLGYLYKANQLAESGSWKKALTFYQKVLSGTDSAALASQAALKLAQYYLEHGQRNRAIEYINKIAVGNPNYFYDHFESSYQMALALSDYEHYKIAATIATALLAQMTPRDSLYEEVLKNRGIWLAHAHDKEAALQSFKRYLTEFPYGEYADEIRREKDALFFDNDDTNVTAALAIYDRIIEEYQGDALADKALFKKATLLFENAQYEKVLALQQELEALDTTQYDTARLIEGSVNVLMQEYLNQRHCKEAVAMSQQYDISLPDRWDKKVYYCAYEAGEYPLAKKIASKYINSNQVPKRQEWLYRYIKADFKLGNYTDVIDASKELITLLNLTKSKAYQEIYRINFDANERLSNDEGMIESIKRIETVFGLDYDDIDRYAQMVALGNRTKDDVMVENYAKKVIYLQEKRASYSQTPYVEFSLADALVKLNKTNEAIEILKSLDEREISSEKRARQKYLLGSLLQKSAKILAAKEAYKQSVEADKESAWGQLAQDALNLMQ